MRGSSRGASATGGATTARRSARIVPVEIEAAFESGSEMPVQPLGLHDLLSIPALQSARFVGDVSNRSGQSAIVYSEW
jgi:hypothetical protein